MRILIEAHHPAHIHFWKYPIRELQARGHEVRMVGRERDVMRRLLEVYDWISAEIPQRETRKNRFPLFAMLGRQLVMFRALRRFRPQVVASLMGSYTQLSKCFGCKNLVFTDSEHQSFNHKIAHPFADEIHTPKCFYLDLGAKQARYDSIHELAFLNTILNPKDPQLLANSFFRGGVLRRILDPGSPPTKTPAARHPTPPFQETGVIVHILYR